MLKLSFLSGILLGFASAAALAAPDGARLYAQNCAACHGEAGNGGIGIPLSLPSFHATVDDDYLRQTIRLGRPGRVMPAFSQLKSDEVEAIIGHLRSWYQGKPPIYSAAPVKGDVKRGQSLFEKHCAGCHGANGEGGHGTGVTFSRPRDFPIMPPALHNPGFLASAKDALIKTTLAKGRAGTPMVAFGQRGFSDRDLNDVVAFVRSFERAPLAGSATILETDSAILSMDSPHDLKTTVENIKLAIGNNNFVFIREQKLESGLVPEGQEAPAEHIVYFCNFGLLNQALATDPRVGLFLPCRITVVEREGKVKMLVANPKRLSRIFNNSELNEMCDQVTNMYKSIMEEAAL